MTTGERANDLEREIGKLKTDMSAMIADLYFMQIEIKGKQKQLDYIKEDIAAFGPDSSMRNYLLRTDILNKQDTDTEL
ncbi:MAG: hypothetical protein V4543_00845 [Bacteroidota bacterium]